MSRSPILARCSPAQTRTVFASILCLLCVLLLPDLSHATKVNAPPTIESIVKRSATDLRAGRPSAAIRSLESLADQSINHPDLSFNRALAYLARSETPMAQSGDRGQAAAAFAETLQMRPADEEATRALREVQLTVIKKANSKSVSTDNRHLGLSERMLLALSPAWLFTFGALASLLLGFGLLFRRSEIEVRQVTGSVCVGVGLLILSVSGVLSWAHSSLFSQARVAVVVSPSALILSDTGASIKGHEALSESTLIHIGPQERGLVPLIGLNSNAWVRLSQVRVLANK